MEAVTLRSVSAHIVLKLPVFLLHPTSQCTHTHTHRKSSLNAHYGSKKDDLSASKSITTTQDVIKQQLHLENLPCPEIHRIRRTQGIMTEERRGQNLRKTVGECEIEVGRHKEKHKMRQGSSVLLAGRYYSH